MESEVTKQYVVCELQREREQWLPLRDRAHRAGGNNAAANLAAGEAMSRIDSLLEELGSLALGDVV